MNRTYRLPLTLTLLTAATSLLVYMGAPWAVTKPTAENQTRPLVSFTFDDGYESTYTKALPILAQYGFRGTAYVDTFNMETPGRMSWTQIKLLAGLHGWEIGSHSDTHPFMTKIPPHEQEEELRASKQALADHGITATSFASPYGDYDMDALARIAKYYETHRGFWDEGSNPWPVNEYLLTVYQVQVGSNMRDIERAIDTALQQKRWLILVFHDIADLPSQNPDDLEYGTHDLEHIASYVAQKKIGVTTVRDAQPLTHSNLLPNQSFDKGLSNGWTTNTPASVRADQQGHGSYPEATNSVSIKADSQQNTYLFSPQVAVEADQDYLIKSYLNVTRIDSGEIGYYIDEYDQYGNWISGQWKKAETTRFVENITFWYTPSSRRVNYARLQIYATPGSEAQAYIDNVRWLPL